MKTLTSYQSQVIDHLGLAAGTYENFIVISGLKWVVEVFRKRLL